MESSEAFRRITSPARRASGSERSCGPPGSWPHCHSALKHNSSRQTQPHNGTGQRSARARTLLSDLLPQRVHQGEVRVSGAVNDGQLTLRQTEMIRKLPVQLQRPTQHAYEITGLSKPMEHFALKYSKA